MFTSIGVTPLVGEVVTQYSVDGRPVEQAASLSYDLYDRNALTWDDDRKVAAFVTASDSAIRNYASYIRSANRDVTNGFYSQTIQFAMQTYVALAAQGILYQSDLVSPFTAARDETQAVDSVSLPREIIKRITGDCDDISVLFNTVMEAGGASVAPVRRPARSAGILSYAGCPGDLWPVGLVETDLGLQYAEESVIRSAFVAQYDLLSDALLEDVETAAHDENTLRAWNRFGMMAGQLGRYDVVLEAFHSAAALDPADYRSLINLGTVEWEQDDFAVSYGSFQQALRRMARNTRVRESYRVMVYVYLARTAYELGAQAEALEFYNRARNLDPEAVAPYTYIVE